MTETSPPEGGCSIVVVVPEDQAEDPENWDKHAEGKALGTDEEHSHESNGVDRAIKMIARWERSTDLNCYDPATDPNREGYKRVGKALKHNSTAATLRELFDAGAICKEALLKNDKIGMRTYVLPEGMDTYDEDGVTYKLIGPRESIHIMPRYLLLEKGKSELTESQVADLATMLFHEAVHVRDRDGLGEFRTVEDRELTAYTFCNDELDKISFDATRGDEWERINEYIITCRREMGKINQRRSVDVVTKYPARRQDVTAFVAVKLRETDRQDLKAFTERIGHRLQAEQLTVIRGPRHNQKDHILSSVQAKDPEVIQDAVRELNKQGLEAQLLTWTVLSGCKYLIKPDDRAQILGDSKHILWVDAGGELTIVYYQQERSVSAKDLIAQLASNSDGSKKSFGHPLEETIAWDLESPPSSKTALRRDIKDLPSIKKVVMKDETVKVEVTLDALKFAGTPITINGGRHQQGEALRPTYDASSIIRVLEASGTSAIEASNK